MTDEVATPARPSLWCSVVWVILLVILLIGIGAGVYGWRMNRSLTQVVTHLQTQVSHHQQQLEGMQRTMAIGSSSIPPAQGEIERWSVAEVRYLVHLADDQLQWTHDVALTLRLLKKADALLQPLTGESILAIRQALAHDLARVAALAPVDVAALYQRLVALTDQFNQLFLQQTSPPPAKERVRPKTGWTRLSDLLHQIVVVRYQPVLTSVWPREKALLYQEVQGRLAEARWAVLQHETTVYQISLDRAQKWIQAFFVQEAPTTKKMLATIAALKKETIQPPSLDLAGTMQLLDAYLTEEQTKSAS